MPQPFVRSAELLELSHALRRGRRSGPFGGGFDARKRPLDAAKGFQGARVGHVGTGIA